MKITKTTLAMTFFVTSLSLLSIEPNNNYVCVKCLSIPRQRAIIHVLKNYCENYVTAEIHESSPSGPTSDHLKKRCENYTYSHFFPQKPLGEKKVYIRSENLENFLGIC